jgi:thymidylate kinase
MAQTDGFVVIDANRPVETVQSDIRRQIRPLLEHFPTVESLIHDDE